MSWLKSLLDTLRAHLLAGPGLAFSSYLAGLVVDPADLRHTP